MRLFSVIADFCVKHAWLVTTFVVALTVLSIVGYVGESFERRIGETDISRDEDPDLEQLRTVRDQFNLARTEALLVIDADDVFTPANIRAIRAAQRAVAKLPQIDSILWLDDLPTLNIFGLPEPVLPEDDASASAFADARLRALDNPLAVGQMIAPDASTAILPITYNWLHIDGDPATGTTDITAAAKSAASQHPEASLRIRLTGNVPLFTASEQSFNENQLKFQIIGYVLVVTLAVFLFRGWAAVMIVAVAPAIAVFWSVGLLDFVQFERHGLTSVVMPVLIIMMGLTDGIHLMVHIRQQRLAGASPAEANRRAIAAVGPACALTSLTTAIGFASLLLAESELVRNFGKGCGFGVVVSFLAIMTIIPLMCASRFGRNVHCGQERDIVGSNLHRYSGIVDWILARPRTVSWAGIVLMTLLSMAAIQLRPDYQIKHDLPSSTEAAQTLLHCDRVLGGIEFVRFVVEWPQDLANDAPEILDVVQRVEAIIDEEPLLRHPLSIRNMVAVLAPPDADLSEQMSLLNLIPPPLRDVVLNEAERRTIMTARMQDVGLAKYSPVFERVGKRLQDVENEYPGFECEITGDPIVRNSQLYKIVTDLATSLGTACVLIFVVMTFAFRSLRLGLISIVPNILPLLTTAGFLIMTGQMLTFTSVCAFTVCIGIAVDDTIHFLTRYHYFRGRGQPVPAALRETFVTVGTALITTTLVLVTGFGTVLMSALPSHRMFSSMAICTIGTALVADLILLPAMLAHFGGKPQTHTAEQATRVDAVSATP